ncbi:hypothetical protein CBL_04989 [Carabus blaptoides fortunei]
MRSVEEEAMCKVHLYHTRVRLPISSFVGRVKTERRNGCDVSRTSPRRRSVCQTDNELQTSVARLANKHHSRNKIKMRHTTLVTYFCNRRPVCMEQNEQPTEAAPNR